LQHLHCRHAKPSIYFEDRKNYLSDNRIKNPMEETMNPIRSFRNWRLYNETVRELNRLNTRQLTDLGISRADIEKVARASI